MEAVIGAVYLDGGLGRGRASWCCDLLGDRIAEAAAGPGRAGLQDPAAGAGGPPFDDAARATRSPTRAPTTPSASSPPCSSAARPYGDGRGPVEEAGRAGRGARRVGAPAGRRRRRPPSREEDGRCLSSPRSRRSGATSSGRSSASGSRPSRSPACARSAATRTRSSSSRRLEGTQDHRRRAARASTCCCELDGGDVLVVHLGMSGQLLRAAAPRTRWRSTPTWSSRSPRAGSCASSTRARSASCSSPTPDELEERGARARRTSASTRSRTPMSWDRLRRPARAASRRS